MDKRKLRYVAKAIVLFWLAMVAFAGIALGLGHLLSNPTLTILLMEVVIYTGAIGFLAWTHYESKRKDESWRSAKKDGSGKDDGWK